jgi:mRNA interferase MazF
MLDPASLVRGAVVWADLDPVRGREQAGRRPALVVSSDAYNQSIPNVIVVLPVTTRDRRLPHHVRLTGTDLELAQPSFAMAEQPRTIDRQRISATAGNVDPATLAAVDSWLCDFLGLPG